MTLKEEWPRQNKAAGAQSGLAALDDLALDLRWTWSHDADVLWHKIDADTWERTRNPWVLLQDISADRLHAFAADPPFLAELKRLTQARLTHLTAPGWFASTYRGGHSACTPA